MSENNQENNRPAITIANQYIRDLSLEIPHAPEILQQINQQPELKVDIDVQNQKIDDQNHVVSLNISLNADIADKKLFILELSYAALVNINVPTEHVEPVLAIEIPRLLFPFARSIITHNLVEGGLPPFMLNPIDFAAVYNARHAANNN